MNFYELEKEEPETAFDVIIFGSSFMILPDQTKALEIAKSSYCFTQENSTKAAASTSCLPFTKTGTGAAELWSMSSHTSNISVPLTSEKLPTNKISRVS
jgi:hypothetical protein